jgi:hypothetical protein
MVYFGTHMARSFSKEWQEVRAYLTREIVAGDIGRKKRNFELWLNKLEKSDELRTLGVSVAIDLQSGALQAKDVAGLFDQMGRGTESPALAFANVLDQEPHSERLLCCSPFPTPPGDKAPCLYVRVIEMLSFFTYYLQPTYLYSYGPADRAQVYAAFLRDGLNMENLADIDVVWTGDRGRVWVLPQTHFEEIMAKNPGNAATVLNDALGLGYDYGGGPAGSPEFVAVFYPETFTHRCSQPTSADAQWRHRGFYLSNGKDDAWGRTHSCSGVYDPVPERVHSGIPNFSGQGFSLKRIGVATPPPKDYEKLLKAAFERYRRFRPLRRAATRL